MDSLAGMKTLTVMTMALSVLTSACSTTGDLPYGYQDGWRRAQIVGIGDGQAALPLVNQDCRAESERGNGAAHYAVTSYSYGGNPNLRKKRVVAVPADSDLAVGDWVYVNVVDCRLALQRVKAPPARM